MNRAPGHHARRTPAPGAARGAGKRIPPQAEGRRAIPGLSHRERAALRRIEAQLTAEDPRLARILARPDPQPLRIIHLATLLTGLVNNGLPIHIGAAPLGHLNLQSARGYVAVFNEDVVRRYQDFLDRRRQARSVDECRAVTDSEWSEFEEHFDRRKVGLGGCARPYGTAFQHEHACLTELTLSGSQGVGSVRRR